MAECHSVSSSPSRNYSLTSDKIKSRPYEKYGPVHCYSSAPTDSINETTPLQEESSLTPNTGFDEAARLRHEKCEKVCCRGPDVFGKLLGPTADESILVGLQAILDMAGSIEFSTQGTPAPSVAVSPSAVTYSPNVCASSVLCPNLCTSSTSPVCQSTYPNTTQTPPMTSDSYRQEVNVPEIKKSPKAPMVRDEDVPVTRSNRSKQSQTRLLPASMVRYQPDVDTDKSARVTAILPCQRKPATKVTMVGSASQHFPPCQPISPFLSEVPCQTYPAPRPNVPDQSELPGQPEPPSQPHVISQPRTPCQSDVPTPPFQPNLPSQPNVPCQASPLCQSNVPCHASLPCQPSVPCQNLLPCQPIIPCQSFSPCPSYPCQASCPCPCSKVYKQTTTISVTEKHSEDQNVLFENAHSKPCQTLERHMSHCQGCMEAENVERNSISCDCNLLPSSLATNPSPSCSMNSCKSTSSALKNHETTSLSSAKVYTHSTCCQSERIACNKDMSCDCCMLPKYTRLADAACSTIKVNTSCQYKPCGMLSCQARSTQCEKPLHSSFTCSDVCDSPYSIHRKASVKVIREPFCCRDMSDMRYGMSTKQSSKCFIPLPPLECCDDYKFYDKPSLEMGDQGHFPTPMEVRYAITKITKFKDFSTFEVMKSTSKKPKCIPKSVEGVFVLKKDEPCCP